MTDLSGLSAQPIPLSDLPAHASGTVHSLVGGHEFCGRVASLGLTAGASLTVVQNFGSGPLLVTVRGTRVALGRTEAARVHIVPSED